MLTHMLDIIIVSLLLFFAITGYMSGLSGKILSLITWGGSATIAYFLSPSVKPLLSSYVKSDLLQGALSFAAIFVIFLILLSLLSGQLSSSIKKSKAGAIDRNLGLVIGLLIGTTFLLISASALRFFDLSSKTSEPFKNSVLYPYVELCLEKVCALLPGVSYFSSPAPHSTTETETNRKEAEILSGFSTESSSPKIMKPSQEEKGYTSHDRRELSNLLSKVIKS